MTDGSHDFFTRTDGSDIHSSIQYFGQEGKFYLAAMDTNGAPGTTDTVSMTWEGINIADYQNLALEVLAATDNDDDGDGNTEDWDKNSLVYFEYQIDGGGYKKVLQFAAEGGDTEPRRDRDLDGVPDGQPLIDTFNSFASPIPGIGSTLDLRVTIKNLTADQEDIAIDEIKLTNREIFGPTALSLKKNSIDENVPANTTVSTFVTSDSDKTDSDNGDTFTYKLVSGSGDADNGKFTIDGDQLKINESPDYESKVSYNIRVQTTDATGEIYQEELTINVNDVGPTSLSLSNNSIDENLAANTVVGTFHSDPNNGDTFKR